MSHVGTRPTPRRAPTSPTRRIGSGGGVSQINAQTVDFGASDMPMTDTRAGSRQGRPDPAHPARARRGRRRLPRQGRPVGSELRRRDGRQDLRRPDHEVERPGDQGAQPQGEPARRGDRARAPLRQLRARRRSSPTSSPRRARAGSRSSAAPTSRSARPSPGRTASAARATTASPPSSARPRALSATSSCSTRSPASSPTATSRTRRARSSRPASRRRRAAAVKTSFPAGPADQPDLDGRGPRVPDHGHDVRARLPEPDRCRQGEGARQLPLLGADDGPELPGHRSTTPRWARSCSSARSASSTRSS